MIYKYFILISGTFFSLTQSILQEYLCEAQKKMYASSPCICTTVPCPMYGSNYLSIPGGGTGSYYYITHGNYPVISTASVTISLSNMDKGSDTTSCTQDYSRMLDDDGIKDCDAGHILAHRLGGPGNQPINIFPQDLSVNRGAYAQYEDSIYQCITKYGAKTAFLSWTFAYSDSTRTKPSSVTYKANYNGGCNATTKTFTN